MKYKNTVKQTNINVPKNDYKHNVLSVYACTADTLVTVAACGSSPHAQCMAGFWLFVSDDFVISSESLLGEVGREFPGLREEWRIDNN